MELIATFEEKEEMTAKFENAVVTEIPIKEAYYEVSNEAGGKTIIIGG